MSMPSAWPRNSPSAARKPRCGAGANLNPTRIRCCRLQLFEEMPTREDVAGLRWVHRSAPPIELDFPQALAADCGRTEVLPRGLLRWLGLLDQRVDGNADRTFRQVGAVEVEHGGSQWVGDIVGCWLAGYAFPTEVACDHRLADQPHGRRLEVSH